VDRDIVHPADPNTPWEETLRALDELVRSGKILYVGASPIDGWQFAKTLHASDAHGRTRFIRMQNRDNRVYREEDREMLPLCADEGASRPGTRSPGAVWPAAGTRPPTVWPLT
jgi:aryl-alcohol dehydrogenase (NADP+)